QHLIHDKGTLPGDTMSNPKNDNHCMAITTRSGRVLGPVEEIKDEGSEDGEESLLKSVVADKSVVINVDPEEMEKHH
ncbi:hypothetical protein HAX54_013037, partial [Datura stramonium]|nr:hypothetical protein [Datura stramonium]